MDLFWVVAFFATMRDLLTIAEAVADRTLPGRHAAGRRTGHAVSVALRGR